MKVICKDNFDRYTISDVLVAENVKDYWAELIAKSLNEYHDDAMGEDYFEAVLDDYKLYKFEP